MGEQLVESVARRVQSQCGNAQWISDSGIFLVNLSLTTSPSWYVPTKGTDGRWERSVVGFT